MEVMEFIHQFSLDPSLDIAMKENIHVLSSYLK